MMQQKSNVFHSHWSTLWGRDAGVYIMFLHSIRCILLGVCLLLFKVKINSWLFVRVGIPSCYRREGHCIIQEEREGANFSHWLLGVIPRITELLRGAHPREWCLVEGSRWALASVMDDCWAQAWWSRFWRKSLHFCE